MLPVKQKIHLILYIFIIIWCTSTQHTMFGISSYSQNDPYPVFSTTDPHDFLDTQQRLELKDMVEEPICDRLSVRISPFGQNATDAKNICKETVCLGNLHGRWSMIGLLLGPIPQGKTLPATLQAARLCLFDDETEINDPRVIDKLEEFGFFDVPLEYRKRGLRFDVLGRLTNDIGVRIQFGFADICQRLCPDFVNRTPCSLKNCEGIDNSGTNEDSAFVSDYAKLTKKNVDAKLMCNLKNIAPEICLDINNFHKSSLEDIRPSIFWRHPYRINHDRPLWPEFLLVPFMSLEASVAVGKERDRNQAFALSFGSDDHHSLAATAGFNVDFTNSIELGCEFGVTHFFDRDFCKVPIPTSRCQSGIFPYTTGVNVQPGKNLHFGAKIAAYHFLERLSFYFQYILIHHDDDCITLTTPDSAFLPEELEKISTWKVHIANIGFNYDISPNVALGILWQAPLSQHNTYRSTSVIWCTLNLTF